MENINTRIVMGYDVSFTAAPTPEDPEETYQARLTCEILDTGDPEGSYGNHRYTSARIFLLEAVYRAALGVPETFHVFRIDNAQYFEEVVNRSERTETVPGPSEEPTP